MALSLVDGNICLSVYPWCESEGVENERETGESKRLTGCPAEVG